MDFAISMELGKDKEHEHREYLSAHPEIKEIISQYVQELLRHKPTDVDRFTRKYFFEKPLHSPLIVVGPSGVGKGTLIKRLMDDFSGKLGFCVSHTTRKPREGEEHGVHYHFTPHDEMKSKVLQGGFIEHAEVHGNLYGTSFEAVASVQRSGRICVLDIDVQGMEAMKRTHFNPRTLFIASPSHQELERRLRGRGTESEEVVLKRLDNALKEVARLETPGAVHHKIVNDDLEVAYGQMRQQLVEWYPHLELEE